MADLIRIKRRTSGSPGAPSGLANAELAYNEVDHTLYYGEGTGGSTSGLPAGVPGASTVQPIAGQGLASNASPLMDGTAAAGVLGLWTRGDHVHPTDLTRAPLANPTFTGTVTISGTITGAGMNTWAASPPPIGSTAPNTGHFTNLVVDNAISGGGLTGIFGTPPAIGNVTPNTGNFTNLSASGVVSGAGFVNLLAPYAPLASPALTGNPTAPTQPSGTNNTTLATTAFALGVRQDQQAPPTAAVNWNNQNIQNLLDPVNTQDAATKGYVDAAAQGLKSKAAVQAATTGANIALSGLQIIDGYTTVAGDRILVKDQTTQANNGLYIAGTGSWNRTTDMDTWSEVPNAYVFVSQGAVNQNSSWTCTSLLTGGTIGVTAITWVQFSQSATVTAGNGLNKVGNTLNVVGTAGRIAVGTAVDIDAGYVGQSTITTVGSITNGAWGGTPVGALHGGTGAVGLAAGYVKAQGSSSPFISVTQIPNSDIAGLGTMASQNANAVAITGGTIDGVVLDGGVF